MKWSPLISSHCTAASLPTFGSCAQKQHPRCNQPHISSNYMLALCTIFWDLTFYNPRLPLLDNHQLTSDSLLLICWHFLQFYRIYFYWIQDKLTFNYYIIILYVFCVKTTPLCPVIPNVFCPKDWSAGTGHHCRPVLPQQSLKDQYIFKIKKLYSVSIGVCKIYFF